jgi:thioredoxin 1
MKISLERSEELEKQINSHKTVLIDFYAKWCSPCKQIKKNIDELENEDDNLFVLEIDVEKLPEIARRKEFDIYSIPALFLFENGKIIKRAIGYLNLEQLKSFIYD